jgi:malonyl-CoA decarboxylase
MSTSFFQDMLGSIAERGRALVERSASRSRGPAGSKASETLEGLSRALLSGQGEASGVALARQLLDLYGCRPPLARIEFFRLLAREFDPDPARIGAAWQAYQQDASPTNLQHLLAAVEPPRQELFRRLNLAPGGTAALVAMREDLTKHGGKETVLRKVDDDFAHLFGSWFNRGFLVLRSIDWSTPADILERIIRYEAVHEIRGWDDLRRRVQPMDRRCFGFFHPSLIDEPLIFVEVALTREIPSSIQSLLAEERELVPVGEATTAVFYSISNCQPGLRGVSFGNFLIKQVVEELSRDLPSLKTFVTLSPAPGFAAWLGRALEDPAAGGVVVGLDPSPLHALRTPGWHADPNLAESLRPTMLNLAAVYYLRAKGPGGKLADPVARFHLGNGARLERLNWLGDTSPKGLREAHGLMVNYLYDLRFIEANHETFADEGTVVASDAVRRHLPASVPQPAREKVDG